MKWTFLKAGKSVYMNDLFKKRFYSSKVVCKYFGLYYLCDINGERYESETGFGNDGYLYFKIPSFSDTEIEIPEGFEEITENEYINALEEI